MRRVGALAAIALAACAMPSGAPAAPCDETWAAVEPVIVIGGDGERQTVPIECVVQIDERRIRIGFRMPAGPDCFSLAAVRLVESADAVEVRLEATRSDDPLAGACPEAAGRLVTEVDLQSPVDDRTLLDGSASSE